MDDYNWTNPYDRRFDYGLSREDVPHNFKFSNVWNIPAPGQGITDKLIRRMDAQQYRHMAERLSVLYCERIGQFVFGAWPRPGRLHRRRCELRIGPVPWRHVASVFQHSTCSPRTPSEHSEIPARTFSEAPILQHRLWRNEAHGDYGAGNTEFRAEFFNVFNNVNFNLPNATQSPRSSDASHRHSTRELSSSG